MAPYQNFTTATYIYAYTLAHATDEEIQKGIDFFKANVHLDKIYIENHRGKVDIPVKRLQEVKALFEKNGIATAGGITATQNVNGIRKPSFYDSFCYTDPDHRKEFVRIVRELASVFDEIILDDFFFTACRCEMCIAAKGKRSWKDYRLDLMEGFARIICDEAKKVNPKMKFVIKYPNWYESYQEAGFNPGKEKDIFDGIYSGNETRSPFSPQHLQRYLSYSIIRLMENTAPGKNGGGWVDLGGSQANLSVLLEQFEEMVYAKTRELTIWNFSSFNDSDGLPALGHALRRFDDNVGKMGEPIGVKTWEPFNGDGEDQLYNYLGMCGIPIEPSPYFDGSQGTVFCTQSTAEDPDCVEKLEEFVRNGGNAIVTVGFFRKMYEQGVKDFTSVRLTNRHVLGDTYLINNQNYMGMETVKGTEKILFEILDYKNNTTWSDITLMVDEDNFPILTEDNYGKGRFFILNVPENFADLYKLPGLVIQNMNKHLSMGQRVYLGGDPKFNLFAYDNNVYAVHGYKEQSAKVNVIVRGACKGIQDLATGKIYSEQRSLPLPGHKGDATTVIEEPAEFAFELPLMPGKTLMFSVLD